MSVTPMPKRLIIAVALVALVSAAAYSQAIERTGFHANKITRDRNAILSFNPVGVWAAPSDLTLNSPTASYVYVYPNGDFKLLSTSCRVQAVARWEYDDTGFLTITVEGGERVESLVTGVPAVRHFDDDGNFLYYGMGQRVLFDTAQYWDFLSPYVDADC